MLKHIYRSLFNCSSINYQKLASNEKPTNSKIARILRQFPQTNLIYCFAYGSAVKKQFGYSGIEQQNAMIDTVFCVDDPQKWHAENLHRNLHHYSFLGNFGSSCVSFVQQFGGAKIYCNTLIPWSMDDSNTAVAGNGLLKYSVITKDNLIDDLKNWTHLYVAGRLQKPVEILKQCDDHDRDDIQEAVDLNLENAVRTALLLLPEQFTMYDLFYAVANLSYAGDFRMIFGENKNKVHNIVTAQLPDFQRLYDAVIRHKLSSSLCVPCDDFGKFIQNQSIKQQLQHLQRLPKALKDRIIQQCIRKRSDGQQQQENNNIVLKSLANNRIKCRQILQKSVQQIVFKSSVFQSLKNIPTAGMEKSLRYSWKKAIKSFALT